MIKNLGLSLSGGGARALIYLGVLKALEEHKINLHVIGGLSGGAIISGLYASGLNVLEIEQLAINLNMFKILDTNPFNGVEVIDHTKFKNLLTEIIGNKKIEDCGKNLLIFATDLNKKELKVFNKGLLVDAIIASSSLPPLLMPYKINNKTYIDGGYSIMYGAKYFRDLGCNVVVGCDVDGFSANGLPKSLKGIFESIVTLVKINAKNELKNYPVDLEIKNFKSNVGMFQFSKLNKDLIDVGYKKTIRYIPKIKKLLS